MTFTWKCWIRWVSCLMGKWNIFKEIFRERRLFGIQRTLEKSRCHIKVISLCSGPAACLSGGGQSWQQCSLAHMCLAVSTCQGPSHQNSGCGGSVLLFLPVNAISYFIITDCHPSDERDLGTANLIRPQTCLRICLCISQSRWISCETSWFSRNLSLRKHALWFLLLKLHFIFIS